MTDWYQQTLTPPDVMEATLKVGVIPSRDHAQVWWEVKDPTTGVLIGQGSAHHTTMAVLPAAIVHHLRNMLEAIDVQAEPF